MPPDPSLENQDSNLTPNQNQTPDLNPGQNHQRLYVLMLVCLIGVGIALATRLSEVMHTNESAHELVSILNLGKPKTDPSFYDTSSSTSDVSSAQPSVPTKDAHPPKVAPAAPVMPTVSAQAYLIGNVATGEIYDERNSSTPLPIASMSKLMTALVATNTISPTTTIEITPAEASVYPDLSKIGAGEKFTEQELLYPLLLDSSNIAAEALASSTNRAAFLNLMNSYAWEIGLPTSFFDDPSGLSPHNAASARGFFALAQYVYKSRPDLLAITRIAAISVGTTTDHGAHDFMSIHPFVQDPRFIGGKTGHTPEASDTMLTILNINGNPIAFIVLGSNDRRADTSLLIDEVSKSLAQR